MSAMLLTVSLLTIGLVSVRSSARQVEQAGQAVASERALMAAQAAADMASAQIRSTTSLTQELAGYGSRGCTSACGDCVPGDSATSGILTGQRNRLLASNAAIDCAGHVCMRQGSVVRLADATGGSASRWCDKPLTEIVSGGDAEARVTVWVRNNAGDALGPSGSGSWVVDTDGRVVITAMATVRNTTITVEQELMIMSSGGASPWRMQSPDEGYGGGHNNDSTVVSVCKSDSVIADAP